MPAATSTNLVPALIGSFVAWRVYIRIRRNIGRQLLNPRRLIGQITFFSIASMVMAVWSVGHPTVLAGLLGGLLLAVPLASYGLRLTRFETTEDGFCYRPNTYIGVALSLILVARLAYRFAVLNGLAQSIVQPAKGFMQSPLTLFVFGLTAGYYITYYAGVYRRSKAEKRKAKPFDGPSN